jgi:sialate O-acetylesterase
VLTLHISILRFIFVADKHRLSNLKQVLLRSSCIIFVEDKLNFYIMRHKLLLILLCSVLAVSAKVKLQPMFSDNMVLQQQTNAPIWGESKPNAKVTIKTSWDGKKYSVKADETGNWKTDVMTPKAGGPFTVTISDGKPVVLHDVMIGEVWLCTGQSNMEMPVVGPPDNNWGKVINYEKEAADANNHPNIRLLHVKMTASYTPRQYIKIIDNGWQKCSDKSIADFSAAGYFFGRNIEKYRNVPIGLIETCRGGTAVEAWTSREALNSVPKYTETLKQMEIANLNNEKKDDDDGGLAYAWLHSLLKLDDNFGGGNLAWKNTGYDDSSWQEMTVPCDMHTNGVGQFYGKVIFRKTIDIPKFLNGKALTLHLGIVDARDITFFNGVEVGYTSDYSLQRVYTIPASLVKTGKAVITVMCVDTSGSGGLIGGSDGMKLVSPPGDNVMALELSGAWKFKTSTPAKELPGEPFSAPTVLYNSMINPLIPYAVKGAIWYQGEANAGHAYLYRDVLPTMINDWRTRWGYKFPFYIVQLANYKKQQTAPEESDWAELREAQLKTLAVENTGMAVAIDIGNADDIHPKNKQEVGRRLSLAARKLTYGEDIPYSGPIYSNYKIEGKTIRLFFNHCDGGLKAKEGTELKGFTIAGADHKFYWADAKIDGNTIVVSSKDVALPMAVRYAWANNPICNLYNGADLPASPFRTDDWPGVTFNK